MTVPTGRPNAPALERLREAIVGPPRAAPDPGTPRGFSDRLLRALGHFRAHPVTFGNHCTLYRHGREAYAGMLEAIEAARDHVNLETYIFQDDAVGRRFAEALVRRAAAGVTVNLIVDAVGCWHTPDAFFERLRRAGVQVLVFHPVAPWRVRHGKRWVLNNRDHRKILVVDGRVGFTGGMNIGDEYDSDGVIPGRWRDTHVRIQGPAVAQLQRVLLATLYRELGRGAVPEAAYFPDLAPEGDHAVRVLPTSPVFGVGRPYVRMVLRRALRAAEKSIHATQAYFLPDIRVLWSLRRAARRGVDVGLVVPSQSDVPLALHAGRSTYGGLLRAGVRIHERLETVLHAKSVVVDGEWSILGSANMDIRSFRVNQEVSVDVLGRDFARSMEQVYEDDLRRSRALDADTWSRRPFLQKVRENVCRLLRLFL